MRDVGAVSSGGDPCFCSGVPCDGGAVAVRRFCGCGPVTPSVGGECGSGRGILRFLVITADGDRMVEIAEGKGENSGEFVAAGEGDGNSEAAFGVVVVGEEWREKNARAALVAGADDVLARIEDDN